MLNRNQLVVEQTEPLTAEQHYNLLVSHFKLLHNAAQIYLRLGHGQKNTIIEKELYQEFQLLNGDLRDDNILTINARFAYIDQLLSRYGDYIVKSSDSLPVFILRQLVDAGKLSITEVLLLVRHELYHHLDTPLHHNRVELLLSRAFAKNLGVEARSMAIQMLFSNYCDYADLSQPEILIELKKIVDSVKGIKNFEKLFAEDVLRKLHDLKQQLHNNSFWHPETLAMLTIVNNTIRERFQTLCLQELDKITRITEQLLEKGIERILKSEGKGWINLNKLPLAMIKMRNILYQDYQKNYQLFLLLLKLDNWLQRTVEEHQLTNVIDIKKVPEKACGWAYVAEKPKVDQLLCCNAVNCISATLNNIDKEWAEERLTKQCEKITKILSLRHNVSNAELIRLQNAWITITPPERAAFLISTEIQSRAISSLIKRAVLIRAEITDAMAFHEPHKNNLHATNGIYGPKMLCYYFNQAQDLMTQLNNYSLRLTSKGDIADANSLIEERDNLKKELYQLNELFQATSFLV